MRHPKKRAFLAAYRELGNIRLACETSGVSRSNHYLWLENDPAYAFAFEAARDDAIDLLEAAARERAKDGVIEPVFYLGNVVGFVRKYSDSLLMFLMKGARPEQYRETHRHEHSGAAGAVPIQIIEVVNPTAGE